MCVHQCTQFVLIQRMIWIILWIFFYQLIRFLVIIYTTFLRIKMKIISILPHTPTPNTLISHCQIRTDESKKKNLLSLHGIVSLSCTLYSFLLGRTQQMSIAA